MKLATLANGSPDGMLAVVSRDLSRATSVGEIAPTMQALLEQWDTSAPALISIYDELNSNPESGEPFNPLGALAPLPRAWQWLDGSAFPNHGHLMQKAFDLPPIETDLPLMYQGISNKFLAPAENVALPSEQDGIDFEGEFGVIVDQVPMAVDSNQASSHIRLVVQINDWSLRTIAPIEMKTGFGWVQAKPACSMAGIAVTPDELGAAWQNHRVNLPLTIKWNDELFGEATGDEMAFGFDELISHAARTRELVAGTVIGSGTVSNANYKQVGSSCIAEKRAIDMIATISMNTNLPDGSSVFGSIQQTVVKASAT